MANMRYKYLHLANYKDIPNWSVQYADEEDLGFTRKYPMARIGSFLTRRKEAIVIQDGIIYKRVTVSTKGGNITIRDEKDGKFIGTKKQFVIHEGQFLLSKIDARNGAYGVVPAIAEGAIITGNFWTYDVDYKRINPQFLTLVTKTQQFLDFAEKSSNGTTNRHYLQEDAFLNQQIPLPSLEEQEIILKDYYINYDAFRKSQIEINKTKSIVERYVFSALSIPQKEFENKNDGFIKFQHFSKLLSWSVNSSYNKGILFSTMYENKLLGEIVAINPQTSFRHLKNEEMISFIPMQSISDEFACWMGNDQCSVYDSKGYTKFKDGDLLWAKITPCMQNGKSAIVQNLTNGLGCGSTEFYVIRNLTIKIDLRYIHCLLRLEALLNDATKHFTGSAGQQRVPLSYLKNLLVPVPPIDIQKEIANHVQKIYDDAEKVKIKGLKSKNEAEHKFEQLIFG
jgi:type I restriction enzyme S subunit